MAEDSELEVVATPAIESPSSAPENQPEGKKKKKKKKKKGKASDTFGTNKVVDTMFKNAFRTELDIISLAAAKVNIMISLNGFIISALVISGVFVFSSSPEYFVTVIVFLITALVSIIFALLAASPEQDNLFDPHWSQGSSFFKRLFRKKESNTEKSNATAEAHKASPARNQLSPQDDPSLHNETTLQDRSATADDLNLLIYTDRATLDRDEYWRRMEQFLREDREVVYKKMSDQLYWLGLISNRKFTLLNISYSVFRWGALASVVTFIGIKSALLTFPGLTEENSKQFYSLGISELEGVYEPSAVVQLPDSRILIVQDEPSRALNLMTMADDTSLLGNDVVDMRLRRSFDGPLNDLEGLTMDEDGFVYAITSHSRTNEGKRSADREQLLRFRIEGNKVSDIRRYSTLVSDLEKASGLRKAIEELSGDKPEFEKLNIEGLAYSRKKGHLMLGLRAPRADGKSIIIAIENPVEVIHGHRAPQFGHPIMLDLDGKGIRSLGYDSVMNSFLIVNEAENEEGDKFSQLWSWSGDAEDNPERLLLPGLINLNNVESIDSILFRGEPRLLILSDEGSKKKDKAAKYMMLEYGQLSR